MDVTSTVYLSSLMMYHRDFEAQWKKEFCFQQQNSRIFRAGEGNNGQQPSL